MEKSIAAAPDDLRSFTTIRRQFFVISLPLFFQKKMMTYLQTEKKWTINLWESQKAKNDKHSKLALPARQQQLETQFQRKFREIIFTKNFVKIYPVNSRYMFELVRMMFVHVVRSFLKQRKRRRGEGGNEIFWWTPFLSQFPKAHLEFHAYVSRKKAPKYAFFHHRLKQ